MLEKKYLSKLTKIIFKQNSSTYQEIHYRARDQQYCTSPLICTKVYFQHINRILIKPTVLLILNKYSSERDQFENIIYIHHRDELTTCRFLSLILSRKLKLQPKSLSPLKSIKLLKLIWSSKTYFNLPINMQMATVAHSNETQTTQVPLLKSIQNTSLTSLQLN